MFEYSLPSILMFLLGVLPIFFAFVFSGFCLFQETERFSTLSFSIAAMVCLLTGDEMGNFFADTILSGFFGYVFTYLFTGLFLLVISNVFVFLIMGGFAKAREESLKNLENNEFSLLQDLDKKLRRENMKTIKYLASGEKAEFSSEKQKKMEKKFLKKIPDIKTDISDMLLSTQKTEMTMLSLSILDFSDLLREFENCIIDIEEDDDMSKLGLILDEIVKQKLILNAKSHIHITLNRLKYLRY